MVDYKTRTNMSRYRVKALSAAISAVLFPFASYVESQESASGADMLEEVVVTGSRITRFDR